MANSEFTHLADDYQIDMAAILQQRYAKNVLREKGIYPIVEELTPSTLAVEHFEQIDDINWTFEMLPSAVKSEFGVKPTELATPVIASSLQYGWDDIQTFNNGKVPIDKRVTDMAKVFRISEPIIALTGTTVANSGVAVTSVSSTGTNSVAASSELDLTSWATARSTFAIILGQIIDGLIELQDPLALVVTPDVYKRILGVDNIYTGEELLHYFNKQMKEINASSPGVVMSKYLGGTLATNADKKVFTAGSTNAALFNINKEYYSIETSTIEPRSRPVNKVDGLYTLFVERFRPVYRKKEAIIYSGTVDITA